MNEQNKQESTLAEEAGLPNSWHSVDSAPITPSQASVPFSLPNGMAPYFSGSISPVLQHDYVFSQTKYGSPAIPSLPLMPLSASGQPSVGAAVQSGSTTTVVDSLTSVAAGPSGSVQFNSGGGLAGSAAFTWNNVGSILTINGGVSVSGTVTITGSIVITGTVVANVFNATTGFQVGGLATLGKYLRGNGTDIVLATLNASDIGAGLAPVTFGGTGANLSATGGVHEVVRQSSVGGAFTVSQLSYSDIGGSATTVPIWNTTAQTTTYSANAGDMVLANTTSGGFTVTLPLSSANLNLSIRVKKVSSDANTLTIGISGSDKIDGQTTKTITAQYPDIEVMSDGAGNWWIA